MGEPDHAEWAKVGIILPAWFAKTNHKEIKREEEYENIASDYQEEKSN